MFTGLVQDVGVIKSVEKTGDWRYVIGTALPMDGVALGASIACGGACMTVVDLGVDWFAVDVSAESLSKTTMGSWDTGSRVNIEMSLKLGDEMGGHIVSGHVDGLAILMSVEAEGDSNRLVFEVPEGFEGFVAPKGSVTIDGVSLTVNEVDGRQFGVNIIPHTWASTSLGDLKAGDRVNFEVDMLARYVARQMEVRS